MMPKPSLDLVRSVTDEQVLVSLLEQGRATRADLAVRTGISKPTISQSVRRLAVAGLVAETGERSTGRGRSGSYLAVADGLGYAAAVSIGPDGVIAEAVDVRGEVVARSAEPVPRTTGPGRVAEALAAAAADLRDRLTGGLLRVVVVSAADPVDRASGRLVHLPGAPFLVGELDPAEVLAGVIPARVVVDNDVNWAAHAESLAGQGVDVSDFVYLYLGDGLGAAVVSDGVVRRGAHGLSGEVAHMITEGPAGRAMPFTQVFAALGLHRPRSTAIDGDRLLRAVHGGAPAAGGGTIHAALGTAIAGVIASAIALTDPERIVVGGTWGADPAVLSAVTAAVGLAPRSVLCTAPLVRNRPALGGARDRARADLRATILARITAHVSGAPHGDQAPNSSPSR